MHCAWSLWVKTVQVDGHTPFLCTVTAGSAQLSGGRCHGCMSNGSWPWYLFRYEHGNTDEAAGDHRRGNGSGGTNAANDGGLVNCMNI